MNTLLDDILDQNLTLAGKAFRVRPNKLDKK